jgi:hypothetical protein
MIVYINFNSEKNGSSERDSAALNWVGSEPPANSDSGSRLAEAISEIKSKRLWKRYFSGLQPKNQYLTDCGRGETGISGAFFNSLLRMRS